MQPLTTPVLGTVTAFTIATPDLERSLTYYRQLGFSEVLPAEWPFPWIQISDGVVLIMLRKDVEPYIALTYYTKDAGKTAKDLEAKGISFSQKANPKDMMKRYVFQSPDGVNISIVSGVEGFRQPVGPGMLAMPPEDYTKPEKYVNKVCGLYGEFAQPVKDLQAAIAFWKLLGFEVVSKFHSPYSWAILSDGLSVIGLHQTTHFSQPAITYFAADMKKKLDELKAAGLTDYTEQEAGNAILTTPEQQHIFLFPLGVTSTPAKPKIGDLKVSIIETDRLLLKTLTPELMSHLFTQYADEDIMQFLGVNGTELETEKENQRKGLTTYRTSFKIFLIVEKTSGKVIGRCGYHTWYLPHHRAEIGYAIKDETNKRQGFMTEAIGAIIDHGFREMDLNRIEAMVGTQNEASIKTLGKFGFVREGLMRSHYFKNGKMEDSIIYSLLNSEYQEMQKAKEDTAKSLSL